MKLPGRSAGPVEWLVVGLGNPGAQYARTPHNVGFLVAEALIARWGLGKPKKAFAGLYADGRTMPGGPRVGVLLPQTFMNESGRSAGPARGALKVDLDHVIAVHDELDLAFGDLRTRMGGGLAGHNGLKSLKAGFGSPDFARDVAMQKIAARLGLDPIELGLLVGFVGGLATPPVQPAVRTELARRVADVCLNGLG